MKKPKIAKPRARPSKKRIQQEAAVIAAPSIADIGWSDLVAIARRKAALSRNSPSSINHLALHGTLAALADIVKSSVSRGEQDGIMEAVTAAGLFAEQIEVAHTRFREKLRKITQRLTHVPIRVSPKMVADKTKERQDLKSWLESLGVGDMVVEAALRKDYPPSIAKQLAIQALNEISKARDAHTKTGDHAFDRVLKGWRELLPEAAKLPPFTTRSREAWWMLAKVRVDYYFKSKPSLLKDIQLEHSGSFDNSDKTVRGFAVKQVRDAFRRLAKSQP